MQSWPFKVIDEDGNPKIEVDYLGETKRFTAQEISSMVLVKVRSLGAPFFFRDISLTYFHQFR